MATYKGRDINTKPTEAMVREAKGGLSGAKNSAGAGQRLVLLGRGIYLTAKSYLSTR